MAAKNYTLIETQEQFDIGGGGGKEKKKLVENDGEQFYSYPMWKTQT